MQENIFNIKGKFGNKEHDIEYVYVLAKAENAFETIYIKYNDGSINKISKTNKETYKDFRIKTRKFLTQIGANNNNKRTKWNVLTKNNKLGINFNSLENAYQNSKISDDVISFNTKKKEHINKKRYKITNVNKEIELDELADEYVIYKVKLVKNIIAASILAFATFSPIKGPWSYFNLKNNLVYTVNILLLLSALIDGIILYGNQKISKKIEKSM